MSRLFLLLVICGLLNVIEARHRSRHHNKRHHECNKNKDRTEKIFRSFYKDVIEVDRKEENFCKNLDDDVVLKEKYGTDVYELIIPVNNATDEDFKIKVHHRALLVKVEDKFNVIRVLPEIVDPKKSSYEIEEKVVRISFSYNIEFGKETEVECDNDIEDKSTYVSKSDSDENEEHTVPSGQEIK